MSAANDATSSQDCPAVGGADFTSVYLAHDAFARDLRRLTDACLLGGAWTPRTATTWSTFTRQLGIHHRAEEEVLWPQLRAWGPPDLAAIDGLAFERAHVAAAVAAAHTAYSACRITAFYDALNEVDGRLGRYMCRDELLALPLLAADLRPAGWAAYTLRLRQLQGRGGQAIYVPWLLDGATRSTQQAVLGALPVAARTLHGARWSRRYRRSHLCDQLPQQ